MEKRSKAPQIYGYAVCLVAVITFLIAVAQTIFAVMDLGDPLYAGNNYNKARYYEQDKQFLLEFEENVDHYETYEY